LRLVFVTQSVDPAHPVLAATVDKVAALAERVDEVVVLADTAVDSALPPNCRARSFRASTRAGRGARFELALASELRIRGVRAVVAHMCPVYALAAAPLARPLRVPVVLWFAHWHDSALLRAAERVSTAVVSVDRRSFPFASRKLAAIGHGIDVSRFACASRPAGATLTVLALGRCSPSKGLDVVIRAVAKTDARLVVRGPALTADERRHRAELERLVAELGVGDRIDLGDAVPRAAVPELFAGADVLVSNMRAGAPDKVVYEASASCVPVVASSAVFDDLVDPELRFERDSPEGLAETLRLLGARPPLERQAIGRELRRRVENRHTVGAWADGVLRAARIA
jgi:glycosyltransferase involved in cell wall biosynthesis